MQIMYCLSKILGLSLRLKDSALSLSSKRLFKEQIPLNLRENKVE
jgi:hypothetical protein